MDVFGRTSGVLNFSSLLTIHLLLILDRTTKEGSEAVKTSSTSAPVPIHLDVIYACDSAATIAWTAHESSNDPGLQKCELTYYLCGRTSLQILDIYLDSHARVINLFNLTHGESYTAFIVCGGQSKTNEVSFVSDSQCEDKAPTVNHTLARSDESLVPTYSHASSFSVVEWSISIAFIVLVLTVAAVGVLYMWKKYQRRQRILRILRHGQNDPFQALYSPTLDSYSF